MVDRPAHCEREDSKSGIEITDEMVKAGYDALYDYDGGYIDSADERVKIIYRAMEAARVGICQLQADNI